MKFLHLLLDTDNGCAILIINKTTVKEEIKMNVICVLDEQYGFSFVIDKDTKEEVTLDYEWFHCDCNRPARMIGCNHYYEHYKCDYCGRSFKVS